jgi:large subunit ribosomal protein L23
MEQIIIKPIVTEKANRLTSKGVYSFIVHKGANKLEIKTAVEKKFGVKVAEVNTVQVLGKAVTKFTKRNIISGRKQSFKKAYITLVKGEFIDLYEGANA